MVGLVTCSPSPAPRLPFFTDHKRREAISLWFLFLAKLQRPYKPPVIRDILFLVLAPPRVSERRIFKLDPG